MECCSRVVEIGAAQFACHRSGSAIAHRPPVDRGDRHDEIGRRCKKGFAGAERFLDGEGSLLERIAGGLCGPDQAGARNPVQNGVVGGPGHARAESRDQTRLADLRHLADALTVSVHSARCVESNLH